MNQDTANAIAASVAALTSALRADAVTRTDAAGETAGELAAQRVEAELAQGDLFRIA